MTVAAEGGDNFAAGTDVEESMFTCRICFEDCAKASELVTPCRCKGTLRFVHLSCLHKWQRQVIKLHGAADERAHTCGVCRCRYSAPPPRPSTPPLLRAALRGASGAAAALALAALGLSLSAAPMLQLSLLALLLLSTRAQSLLALSALLALAALLVALHGCGLRLVLRPEAAAGGRYGLALIRHGAPVDGLRSGVLLAASPRLDSSVFERAVVLVTEHGALGTKGVMLTQPLDMGGVDGDDSSHSSLHHFVGGPVDLPTPGRRGAALLLHQVATLPGARQLHLLGAATGAAGNASNAVRPPLPAAAAVTAAAAGLPMPLGAAASDVRAAITHQRRAGAGPPAGTPHAPAADTPPVQLFVGGSLDELLLLLQQQRAGGGGEGGGGGGAQRQLTSAKPGAGRAAAGGESASGAGGGGGRPQVLVFHGIASWAAGQLEGELRAGAWAMGGATGADVLPTPPRQLWAQLMNSGRLRWV